MAKDVFGIVGTTQAGSFQVESVVAEGGFGVVYRAQHGAFRAPVALKCLKIPEEMTAEQRHQFLDKFREEGELLFRLSAHIPAVVRPLHVDVLELPGDRFVPFLALEWLEGSSLDVIVSRRAAQGKPPLALEKLVPFLTPVAQALACAHRFPGPEGPIAIIHRDLKPENIFVAESQGDEVVKILDYGIARTRSAATLYAGRATHGNAFDAFTPGYASPEQWLPKRYGQTGPWTDVWGLSLTMVEALIGRPPIAGDVPAMMGTTLDESLRPTPRAEGLSVSDEVEAIFGLALAVDPRRRTQSIEELWTQLERALGLPPSLTHNDSRVGSGRAQRINTLPPSNRRGPLAPASLGASPALGRGPGAPHPSDLLPTMPAPISQQSSAPASASAPSASSSPASPRRSPAPASGPGAPGPESARRKEPRPTPEPPSSPPSRRSPSPPRASPAPEIRLELDYRPAKPRPDEPWSPPRPGLFSAATLARLRLPFWLLFLSIAVGIADNVYFRQVGEILRLGPARPSWIVGPLALFGVGLGCLRLLRRDE